MASQSVQTVPTNAPRSSEPASARASGGDRGNGATAERVEAEATSRPPTGFTSKDGPVDHEEALAREAVNAEVPDGPERKAGAREVRILRSEDDPLAVFGTTPSEADLYTERPLGKACDPEWDAVEGIRGSVARPSRTEEIAGGSLFVGGAPSVLDVHQGQVGDCYLMAALIGLVAADPGRISQMIRVSGNSAVVSFFRFDDGPG